jgi:predicted glycosyltransferase
MSVFVAIGHYPHVNFYKNAIQELKRRGIEIKLIVQPRGNLTAIVEHEIGLPFKSIGHHQSALYQKAINLLFNDIKTFSYVIKNSCDVATGVCGGIELAHATFICRKPSVIFEDDIEQRLVYYLYKPFATRIVVPHHVPAKGHNILKYNGFKELAYLHPNYFIPREDVLKEYGLGPESYVFIREVSNTTTNYYGLKEGSLAKICPELRTMGFDIVLSLENKTLKNLYKDYCTILQEPVSDIHSLMHYAAFTIASGDSMSRESCLLGTPAIYTGGRNMSINSELEKMGCLLRCEPEKQQILTLASKILKNNLKARTKQIIGEAMATEWEDTTQVIINNLLAVLYKDDSLIEKYKTRR